MDGVELWGWDRVRAGVQISYLLYDGSAYPELTPPAGPLPLPPSPPPLPPPPPSPLSSASRERARPFFRLALSPRRSLLLPLLSLCVYIYMYVCTCSRFAPFENASFALYNARDILGRPSGRALCRGGAPREREENDIVVVVAVASLCSIIV